MYQCIFITLTFKSRCTDNMTFNVSMTANFFCTLNQQHVKSYYQIKSQCSKLIHTRLDCWLCAVTCATLWNDYFQLSSYIFTFMHETTYAKVHFYVWDLRGFNKPVAPMGINGQCHAGFDSYYKIAVRDHVRVPKFWRTWRTWANTQKTYQASYHLPSDFPNNSSYVKRMKDCQFNKN